MYLLETLSFCKPHNQNFFCYIRFFKNKFIHTISLFFTKKIFPPQNPLIYFVQPNISELPPALYEVYMLTIVQFFENSTKFKTWKSNYTNFSPYALSRIPASWLMLQTTLKIRHTVPIDRIISVKNARAWVSMDFK